MFEKIKGLTTKKKIEYIWDYYRLHFFAFICCALLAGSLINSIFINPAKEIYSSVSFFGTYIPEETASLVGNALTDAFVSDKKNYEVKVYNFYSVNGDPMFEDAMATKFFSMYVSEEMDLVICDGYYLRYLISAGFIVNLDSFLDDEQFKHFAENNYIYEASTEEYPETLPYAISLRNSAFIMDNTSFADNDSFIGFVRNSERTKEALEILRFLLDN